jgi:propanediol dehydratase small subunit
MNGSAFSGRPTDSITVEAVVAGDICADDVRIHPDTLHRQADVAATAGNPQLAEALRRSAEIATLAEQEVLSIYEALRPGRSSAADLEQLAQSLQTRQLTRVAALVDEACTAYRRRGLVS